MSQSVYTNISLNKSLIQDFLAHFVITVTSLSANDKTNISIDRSKNSTVVHILLLSNSLTGQPTERVTSVTASLSTWRPLWGPMSLAPMAASSRIDRGYHNLSKTISFWPFFRVTFSWNDPYDVYH